MSWRDLNGLVPTGERMRYKRISPHMPKMGSATRTEVAGRFGPWLKGVMTRSCVTSYRLRANLGLSVSKGTNDPFGGKRVSAILNSRLAVTAAVAIKIGGAAGASAVEGLWYSYPSLAMQAIDEIWSQPKDLAPGRRWYYLGGDLSAWALDVVREPCGRGAAALYCCFYEPPNGVDEQKDLVDALWRALAVTSENVAAAKLVSAKKPKIREPRLRVAASILADQGIDFRLRFVAAIPLVRAAARSQAAGLFDDALREWGR